MILDDGKVAEVAVDGDETSSRAVVQRDEEKKLLFYISYMIG